MPTTPKRQLGDWGEDCAVKWLTERGYRIWERNWRLRGGEIDIVAVKKGGWLKNKIGQVVFVEVKTIKSEDEAAAALAAQNVHHFKRQCLIRTAQNYLIKKRIPVETPWQIDVLIVVADQDGGLKQIQYLANAVWAE